MLYRALADTVLVAHFAFVLFAVLGGLLALRWHRAVWLHVPALAWGLLVQLANWECPLTPLENYFRRLGGEAGYAGGFVEHYVSAILYPEHITHAFRFVLGLFLLVINLVAYSFVFYSVRAAPPRTTSSADS
ncbi:MAG TPA: DUF2784 domain-containing protein [Pyrinomonadaceae bacterium]